MIPDPKRDEVGNSNSKKFKDLRQKHIILKWFEFPIL
jgi:hypothetical protein